MKSILRILFIASILVGCKKTIHINVNKGSSQLVIEGIVSNRSTTQTVKMNKSVSFYNDNNYPTVSGALVTISDNGATPVIASEVSSGQYQIANMPAISGHTYYLSVTVDGNTYTAQSTMPYVVNMYKLDFFDQTPGITKKVDKRYSTIPKYDDPIQYVNSYRFVQYDNGVKDKRYYVRSDNVTNGTTNEEPLFGNDLKIKSGDTITVEMFGIDPNVYHYFYVLSSLDGDGPGGGTTPSNPESNISGGVLGYFSAETYQSITTNVP